MLDIIITSIVYDHYGRHRKEKSCGSVWTEP